MAILLNFSNVFAIAFAYSGLATYLQSRRFGAASMLKDRLYEAINAYKLDEAHLIERRILRRSVDNSTRRVSIWFFAATSLVVVNSLSALGILIFSGIYPSYSMPNSLVLIILAVLIALPFAALLGFDLSARIIVRDAQQQIAEAAAKWEAAGFRNDGTIRIPVLAKRFYGVSVLPPLAPALRVIWHAFARLRRHELVELDKDTSDVLSQLADRRGTDEAQVAQEALAFLEHLVNMPEDSGLVIKDKNGRVIRQLTKTEVLEAIKNGAPLVEQKPRGRRPRRDGKGRNG